MSANLSTVDLISSRVMRRRGSELIDLAYEVNYRGRFRLAAWIYLCAANAGGKDALLYLADNRHRHGDIVNAEIVYRAAVQTGSSDACISLIGLLKEKGDRSAAERVAIRMLQNGTIDSENWTHTCEGIVRALRDEDDFKVIRSQLQHAANRGNSVAIARLEVLDGALNATEGADSTDILSKLSEAADALRKSAARLEVARGKTYCRVPCR